MLRSRATFPPLRSRQTMYRPNCAGDIGIGSIASTASLSFISGVAITVLSVSFRELHHRLRHAGRPDHAVPLRPLQTDEAGFRQRRHVGQQGMPRGAGDRERPDRPDLMCPEGRRKPRGDHLRVAGDEVGERGRDALVGDVTIFMSTGCLKSSIVRCVSEPGRPSRNRSCRVLLRVVDGFLHVFRRHRGADHQHVGRGADHAHRREFLHRVLGHLARRRIGPGVATALHQRIAVGRARAVSARDHASAAADVVDHHRLSSLRPALGDRAPDEVAVAARTTARCT